MPYAIIRTGGKQYRVNEGDLLQIEKIDAAVGADVDLDDVLAVGEGAEVKLDGPELAEAAVKARVIRHDRGRKIRIWKFKRRKGYECRQGHRQDFTEVRITSIPGGPPAEIPKIIEEKPEPAGEEENPIPDQE